MDYKEKYNEAHFRAEQYLRTIGDVPNVKSIIEHIFPDLVETEDERNERIRKGLLNILKLIPAGSYEENWEVTPEEVENWLTNKEYELHSINFKYIEDMVDKFSKKDEFDSNGNNMGKPGNGSIRAYRQGLRDAFRKVGTGR